MQTLKKSVLIQNPVLSSKHGGGAPWKSSQTDRERNDLESRNKYALPYEKLSRLNH